MRLTFLDILFSESCSRQLHCDSISIYKLLLLTHCTPHVGMDYCEISARAGCYYSAAARLKQEKHIMNKICCLNIFATPSLS